MDHERINVTDKNKGRGQAASFREVPQGWQRWSWAQKLLALEEKHYTVMDPARTHRGGAERRSRVQGPSQPEVRGQGEASHWAQPEGLVLRKDMRTTGQVWTNKETNTGPIRTSSNTTFPLHLSALPGPIPLPRHFAHLILYVPEQRAPLPWWTAGIAVGGTWLRPPSLASGLCLAHRARSVSTC